MAERIRDAQTTFQTLLWEGMPGPEVRILDHGVCSGLLLLLFSTFFFRIHFGLGPDEPPDRRQADARRLFLQLEDTGSTTNAYWWWTFIVWGTAAAAIHNLQQFRQPWPGLNKDNGKLDLEDDALAYLGILVDIMQEWDRYTVFRSSVLSGTLPLQGCDVELSASDGKVVISYGSDWHATKVRNELEKSLNDWEKIIVITG